MLCSCLLMFSIATSMLPAYVPVLAGLPLSVMLVDCVNGHSRRIHCADVLTCCESDLTPSGEADDIIGSA
mgnify:CR=1 FL=1